MPTELRDKLQEALDRVYVIERELGGGGMSRVFVARDDALGRLIVVKLLPPEMADVLRSTPRFQSLLKKIGPADAIRGGPGKEASGNGTRS